MATALGFKENAIEPNALVRLGFDDRFERLHRISYGLEWKLPERALDSQWKPVFLHVDCHEVHYCKIMLDEIFGRDSFMNEIIWAYDYGARTKRRWSAKHDNILWYVIDP